MVASRISRGLTIHQTGTVPLCSTIGAASSMLRTSMAMAGGHLPSLGCGHADPVGRIGRPHAVVCSVILVSG